MATTLTRKGQVTVPKKIRDYLGLTAGLEAGFVLGPHGEVIVQPADGARRSPRHGRFEPMRGALRTGRTSDELMRLLRDYDADADDPGLQ